ncbi:MAG: type I-E CRISPR-associated endonuclease Cas1 [Lachnospiraceae bacterium]|nr:type I-E CRISPR-associated endonuclease Cas1 [Lachnospiraceae bacterium]MBR6157040.1 type I-E CRISPR-associated endonuclease Cas1 [Lachnospiraceae bacterium]
MLDEKNKHLLTRTEDRISFLYIDKARIEQTEYGIQVLRGDKAIEVPITTINCLILGPGTSITHKAVCNIASAGCSICFSGTDLSVFYAYGEPATNRSKNMLQQIRFHENKQLHLDVVHKMYEIRYPDSRLKTKSIEELRGIEGQRVKDCYLRCAEEYDVDWSGRSYKPDDFFSQDIVNQYLTALNHTLYAIVTAAIVSLGFSPMIGFIHTGHTQSFTFDIADLYKEEITIPLAFALAHNGSYDRHKMLLAFRRQITEKRLMTRIVKDLLKLFYPEESTKSIEADLQLWDPKQYVKSGINYADS